MAKENDIQKVDKIHKSTSHTRDVWGKCSASIGMVITPHKMVADDPNQVWLVRLDYESRRNGRVRRESFR